MINEKKGDNTIRQQLKAKNDTNEFQEERKKKERGSNDIRKCEQKVVVKKIHRKVVKNDGCIARM